MRLKFFFLFLLGFILIVSTLSFAESRYVTGDIKITLRTGPDEEHKIISMIRTGTLLEVLEEGDVWTRVRTSSGKEGWVMNRFIVKDEPSLVQYEELKKEYDTISKELDELKAENDSLKMENAEITEDMKKESRNSAELKSNYDKLVSDSSEYLQLKKKLEAIETEGGFSKNMKWFISGAAVLIIGILLGTLSKRKRKKYTFK